MLVDREYYTTGKNTAGVKTVTERHTNIKRAHINMLDTNQHIKLTYSHLREHKSIHHIFRQLVNQASVHCLQVGLRES